MDDKPQWQRVIVIALALAALAGWIAGLLWLKANPGSAWWWVFGPAIVAFFVVLTVQKLRRRSTPVDGTLDLHVRYLLMGFALSIGGLLGQIPAENLITRAALVLVTVLGVAILIAGFHDLTRWRAAEDGVVDDDGGFPPPDGSGADVPR